MKIKRKGMAIIIFLLIPRLVNAATYHIDATTGSDDNNGLSQNAAWKNIAKINASRFSPGDQILFKRGEVWREQLSVPSSGAAGKPITFGAYGTGANPIINGSDIVSTWIDEKYPVYFSTTTETKQVFYAGSRLSENDGATTAVGKREWDWDNNKLYINVGEDPTGKTVEISQREYTIYIARGINYVTIDGFTLKYANGENIHSEGSNINIQNCNISYAAEKGITWATTAQNVLIYNNSINFNGWGSSDAYGSGIFVYKANGSSSNEAYIKGNSIHNNKYYGIHLWSNYWVTENNDVYDNGNTAVGVNAIEIIDSDNDGYGENNTVRFNRVWGQISSGPDGTGIAFEDNTSNNIGYYNIVWGCDGPGFSVWRGKDASYFNNVSYGNNLNSSHSIRTILAEFAVAATGINEVSNVKIKNNIAVATQPNTYAIYVGAYAVGSTGLDITNNDWYASAANWYLWNSTTGNNLTLWNGFTGVGTDLNSDPLFVSTSDFHLRSSSPAINAGTNVGLTQDYQGLKVPLGRLLILVLMNISLFPPCNPPRDLRSFPLD